MKEEKKLYFVCSGCHGGIGPEGRISPNRIEFDRQNILDILGASFS